jgi:hypothetical protein
VVSASKSGATAPIWSAISRPHAIQVAGEFCKLQVNFGVLIWYFNIKAEMAEWNDRRKKGRYFSSRGNS